MYSENAKRVLAARYYRYDETQPEQLFWRVANYIATAEEQNRDHWAGEFYEMMANLEFLPNTPCLMNAGTDIKNLSACFVLEIPDNMEGIFDTLKHTALIFKGGGGVGLYLGNLRPAGDTISTIKPSGTLKNIGVASGPISFAKIYDVATEQIMQGGVRKGALMGVLPCWHPDVLDFISCKRDLNMLQNFNISVSITDQFIEAVKHGGLTPIINPKNKQVIDRVPARPIMDKLVENAHATGEPGIIFIDRINATNALPDEPIRATNPCVTSETLITTDIGDVPIIDRVGLKTNVWNGSEFSEVMPYWVADDVPIWHVVLTDGRSLNCSGDHLWVTDKGDQVPTTALQVGQELCGTRLPNGNRRLYNQVAAVVDLNFKSSVYCFTEPKKHLGCFNGIVTAQCGEAPQPDKEACILGSLNLVKFVKRLADGRHIFDFDKITKTVRTSVRFLDNVVTLGEFPIPQIKLQVLSTRRIGFGVMGWADSLALMEIPYGSQQSLQLAETLMFHINEAAHHASMDLAGERGNFPKWGASTWARRGIPRRNVATTTLAPTGSLSIIADCSGGIEPIFELAFVRNLTVGTMKYINPILKQKAEEYGFTHLLDQIIEHRSLDLEGIPDHVRQAFRTSRQVTPEQHVKMLAAFQKYTENAVSKTVNLPASAGIRDVESSMMLAHELGCKGITVYRDGSRANQPMQ